MNDFLKTINEKGAKLSRWQTYSIILLFTLTLIVLPAYNISTANQDKKILAATTQEQINLLREMNKNLNTLNETVLRNNLNNVSLDGAINLYDKTYQASKYRIIELIMNTMTNNHIDDDVRRLVIKRTFKTTILNLYTDDYEKLSKFKYGDKRLNVAMDKINAMELVDGILLILFNEKSSHEERRKDLILYLNQEFDTYYQNSIKQL